MNKDNEPINNLTKDIDDYIACKDNTSDISQLLIESSKSSENDNVIDTAINASKKCLELGEKITSQVQNKKVNDAIKITKSRLEFNIMYLKKIDPAAPKKLTQKEINAGAFGTEIIRQHEESSWESITKDSFLSATPIAATKTNSYYTVGFFIILLLFLVSKNKKPVK